MPPNDSPGTSAPSERTLQLASTIRKMLYDGDAPLLDSVSNLGVWIKSKEGALGFSMEASTVSSMMSAVLAGRRAPSDNLIKGTIEYVKERLSEKATKDGHPGTAATDKRIPLLIDSFQQLHVQILKDRIPIWRTSDSLGVDPVVKQLTEQSDIILLLPPSYLPISTNGGLEPTLEGVRNSTARAIVNRLDLLSGVIADRPTYILCFVQTAFAAIFWRKMFRALVLDENTMGGNQISASRALEILTEIEKKERIRCYSLDSSAGVAPTLVLNPHLPDLVAYHTYFDAGQALTYPVPQPYVQQWQNLYFNVLRDRQPVLFTPLKDRLREDYLTYPDTL